MDQAHHLLALFSGLGGYVLFFSLVVACGIGFPFNSDLTLVAAAVMSASGVFHLEFLMPLAFLGLLTGDTICFFVARKWGKGLILKRPFRWILSEKKLLSAESSFKFYGKQFLFFVRFLPLIRTALFFAAGTLQVNPSTFYLMNATSTLIYVPVLMLSSYYAAAHIETVLIVLKQFQYGVLGSCILAIIIWILYRKRKKCSQS